MTEVSYPVYDGFCINLGLEIRPQVDALCPAASCGRQYKDQISRQGVARLAQRLPAWHSRNIS